MLITCRASFFFFVPLSPSVTAVITLCEICTAITAANLQLHRLGQAEYGKEKKKEKGEKKKLIAKKEGKRWGKKNHSCNVVMNFNRISSFPNCVQT